MKHQRIDPDGGITQSSHGSPVETLLEFAELPKRIRKWTQKITQQSQQQQARLDNLERELRNSTGDDANTCAASTARSEGSGTGVRITQDDEFPASGEEVEDNRSHAVDLSDDRNGEQTIDKAQQAEYENDKYYTEKAASSIIETEDGNQPSNAEIHRTASELLAKAREVTRDFDRKSPLGDYTRLVEQIDLNELAVDDSMDMIKSMAKSNNTEAMEHLQDIKELMGSIRKEKTRCDAKLTVIIAQRWKGRQPDLDLLQQPSGTELIDVPHSKFVKAFGKLERNVEEVVALQVELTKRLRWLKAEDTGKGEQFTKLLGLSRKLEAELSAKSMLERQCDNRCVEVLQLDAGIRASSSDGIASSIAYPAPITATPTIDTLATEQPVITTQTPTETPISMPVAPTPVANEPVIVTESGGTSSAIVKRMTSTVAMVMPSRTTTKLPLLNQNQTLLHFQSVASIECSKREVDKIYTLYSNCRSAFDLCVLASHYQIFPFQGKHPTQTQIQDMAGSDALRCHLDQRHEEEAPSVDEFLELVAWRYEVDRAKAAGVPYDSSSELFAEFETNLNAARENTTIRVNEDLSVDVRLPNGAYETFEDAIDLIVTELTWSPDTRSLVARPVHGRHPADPLES
ncbi:uncharacterized protein PITG_01025 [Phytophthora infestans T30-4]|uniref:Uncharacterized protein n=1 Tax=Phytophthora infestans (strain T30-4) TaxID=403677 RepID=D0MS95_PHYIT|nr:uncharacterized protein PITG_01025 [Phytophthora infestans T30-4]EEY58364.1 conserved hypothetical protein [Phytophthora infestans T30-4]|eukprot:XP_002909550.1 conserved hypothetical protein [Phytophthora infestans T30-4]